VWQPCEQLYTCYLLTYSDVTAVCVCVVMDQAYVTLATNDSYALGALVLGHSLRNTGTTRTLVVMITSDVTESFRYIGCCQGGYIFYAGGSIAGVSCRRRWPRLLLLS